MDLSPLHPQAPLFELLMTVVSFAMVAASVAVTVLVLTVVVRIVTGKLRVIGHDVGRTVTAGQADRRPVGGDRPGTANTPDHATSSAEPDGGARQSHTSGAIATPPS